ncbi:MAG: nitroreductase family protein [Anaerolineae bacterium]|nr:nitroreductase family protein [Anaerolineae bacterium]
MEFSEVIQHRYSVRAYKPDSVEEEKLQQVLEAARIAPTGANRQAFQLVVIHTRGREKEMLRIYGRDWFAQAPIVIAACAAPDYKLNVGIVMDHLILAATDQGLGTCWIGAFDRDAAREVLGIPDEVEPIILATLGYAADELRPKQRKALSELVRYEHW